MSTFEFIHAEKAHHSVSEVCKVLEVSRSGYPTASRVTAAQCRKGPRQSESARLRSVRFDSMLEDTLALEGRSNAAARALGVAGYSTSTHVPGRTNMTEEEFAAAFQEAFNSRERGDIADAIRRVRELRPTNMHRSKVVGMLGLWLYYDQEDVDGALPLLKESVTLSPSNEKASLALFHAQLGTKEVDAAFAEARRHLANNESQEYRRLMRELANAEQDN